MPDSLPPIELPSIIDMTTPAEPFIQLLVLTPLVHIDLPVLRPYSNAISQELSKRSWPVRHGDVAKTEVGSLETEFQVVQVVPSTADLLGLDTRVVIR